MGFFFMKTKIPHGIMNDFFSFVFAKGNVPKSYIYAYRDHSMNWWASRALPSYIDGLWVTDDKKKISLGRFRKTEKILSHESSLQLYCSQLKTWVLNPSSIESYKGWYLVSNFSDWVSLTNFKFMLDPQKEAPNPEHYPYFCRFVNGQIIWVHEKLMKHFLSRIASAKKKPKRKLI